MAFKGYSNFTRGIKDPSVFDVPPQCESAPLEHLVSLINSIMIHLYDYICVGIYLLMSLSNIC